MTCGECGFEGQGPATSALTRTTSFKDFAMAKIAEGVIDVGELDLSSARACMVSLAILLLQRTELIQLIDAEDAADAAR
jgi:hypothetical protein